MKISLEDGKYEVAFDYCGKLSVYRHGELWSDETGNNLLLAMMKRIEDLEDELDSTISVIEDVVNKNPTSCDSVLVNFLENREEV